MGFADVSFVVCRGCERRLLTVASYRVSTGAVTDVTGLEGHEARLPCDTVSPPGDTTLIVLWYRVGSDAPVYR